MKFSVLFGVVLGLGVLIAPPAVRAAGSELSIGVNGAVTSTDPQWHRLATNNALATHFFDKLVMRDENSQFYPGLATSWRALDDLTWEFKLRQGVHFSDGSEFGPEDVIATLNRAANVPNSPAPFVDVAGTVAETKIIDPTTLHFITRAPSPLLPTYLSDMFIISRKAAEATTADFNSGKAMIGTGPYRFEEFVPGDRVTMVRNDGYWGPKEPWTKVTYKMITNGSGRVAALRSGAVDVIAAVPTADIPSLKKLDTLNLVSTLSSRVVYMSLDQFRDQTPFVTDKAGQPLPKNPLKDLRVRQALSKAIDRDTIAERVLEGNGKPAAQLLPDGLFGTSKHLVPEKVDIAGAKALLAEAGYPDGFRMVINGPNDRYINDARVVQAIGQMLTRIGIDARPEVMPYSMYATRVSNHEFSFYLSSWGSFEMSSPLRNNLATPDRAKGYGGGNNSRYSNPKLDAVLDKAVFTIDDTARAKLLAEASEIAMKDLAAIPLHFEISTWAARKGLDITGRLDQYTLAMGVRQAP
jgi:peptide/nickel transport system substrate-binding protein